MSNQAFLRGYKEAAPSRFADLDDPVSYAPHRDAQKFMRTRWMGRPDAKIVNELAQQRDWDSTQQQMSKLISSEEARDIRMKLHDEVPGYGTENPASDYADNWLSSMRALRKPNETQTSTATQFVKLLREGLRGVVRGQVPQNFGTAPGLKKALVDFKQSRMLPAPTGDAVLKDRATNLGDSLYKAQTLKKHVE